MNTAAFLANAELYFNDSYAQFELFGGPCTYFHQECLAPEPRNCCLTVT